MLRIFVAALAIALGFAPLAVAQAADCKLQQVVDLPVTMSGTRPMVSAKLNGHDVTFMADSGAFYSTLSPAIATELGLRLGSAPFGLRVSGVGGEADVHLTTVKTFTFAGVPLPNIEFLVSPGAGGGESAGLLGQNIWGLWDVEYDLGGGAIRLFKPHDCGGDQNLAYWSKDKPINIVRIGNDEGLSKKTFADAFVNGKRIRVIFDSGASTSVMTLAAAERVGLRPNDPGVRMAGVSTGLGSRALRNWIGPVDSFKIGDEEVKNTRMRFGEIELSNADMLLGADFFLSHRIYVANSQRRLFFTYSGGPVFNLTAPQPSGIKGAEPSIAPSTSEGEAPKAPPAPPAIDEPKDAGGYSRRGAAAAARRDYERAVADYTKAIELDPTDPTYPYQRALAHMALRQLLLAGDDLNLTLKLQPDNIEALANRAELRLGARDRPGAIADVDKAAELAPRPADIHLRLASFYERVNLFDQAVAQFDLWISTHQDEGEMSQALAGRCRTRALAGKDLDKALNDCNRALRLGPRSAGMFDSRGMIYLRQGDYERAITDYNAALTLNPRIAWSLYGRGLARQHQGLKTESDADIAAALAIAPRLAETAQRLGITPAKDQAH
jgi:tetratricopeptide (TPR) repeat protein/predicted aspartyl protease